MDCFCGSIIEFVYNVIVVSYITTSCNNAHAKACVVCTWPVAFTFLSERL